ncbi:MAG: acetyl-CoA carboxylase biotin carboxylase subunit [Lentisphaeria bacterium]
MFNKVLIANRGEIALRVVRACRELGIQSVVAYSLTDEHTLAVKLADEAICIGPGQSSKSYLNIAALISAAEICDADAIHPGYGFLSENAHFAEVCAKCGITFIGPKPEVIRRMGDKAQARKTMVEAGVPVTPGSDGIVESEEELLKLAHQFKYPVIIKAVAGGGGRGMRVAHNDASLIQGFHSARAEAASAFGNAAVYLEKFIINPRHIEVQIMADNYGNVIHLGERDCSLQRRNQKLIEEAPSPALDEKTRKEMGDAAVRAAKASNYNNVGTIEFLYDASGEYYFMEMNTRVQVEHPVTEMVTGVDIIKEQIKIASGQKLAFTQDDIVLRGHAIECRINAENPKKNFAPCPGKINLYLPPGGPGVRVDSHCYSGYTIPPTYDSMIGKLICHADTRGEAIARSLRALNEFVVDGIDTSIPFAAFLLRKKDVQEGKFDTGYIEKVMEQKVISEF